MKTATAAPLPVVVESGDVTLNGDLSVPANAFGLVVFAHGSGSSRHSTRNRAVAGELTSAGLATLLLDLLTKEEERDDAATGEFRFDISLLAARVISALDWARLDARVSGLNHGVFGGSTGAAAALVAAAHRPEVVRAVVSRGGRPDLAGSSLETVLAPTLLIVGGRDDVVIGLNQDAYDRLRAQKELQIVPGATHLFEEPGALDQVARLASAWFERHLA